MRQTALENDNLPDFQDPDYKSAADDLQLTWDMWIDLKGRTEVYLPQEYKEPGLAYKNRLKRCAFDNRFEPIIRGHAGLLSTFSLNDDIAPSIKGTTSNIDNRGNDIYTFFCDVDTRALRDGWCAVLVDYPPSDPDIKSNADFIASGRRPYLVAIDRRDILNWRTTKTPLGLELAQVTIQERRLEPSGRFGVKEQMYYRVLYPGGYTVYQIKKSDQGEPKLIEIEQGETSLDFIPLIYYSVSESELFTGKPPFLNLARLNVEHYQKRSQLNEILWKCNLPVPVRKGLIKTASDVKTAPPVTIGPNSAIDIPADGDFYFAEPSGAAIAATKQDIADLEAAMDRMGLAFLSSGDHDKTATEVLLSAAQTSANLKEMARRKQNAIQQAFEYWVQYTGEGIGGTISIDDTVLQAPLTAEQTNALESLATSGFISQETLLTTLQKGKVLPRDFDVLKEVSMTRLGSNESDNDEDPDDDQDDQETGDTDIGPASGTSGGVSN